ncbi:MAG: hypothetical protein HYZ53_29815 [Planctomycetes bacterium]|nr:hypothetical protein [Planctomycetota bacterium]
MLDQRLLEFRMDIEKETKGEHPGDGVMRRLAEAIPHDAWRPSVAEIAPTAYSADFWSGSDTEVLTSLELFRSHDRNQWRLRVVAEAYPYRNKTPFLVAFWTLVPLGLVSGIYLATHSSRSVGGKVLLSVAYAAGLVVLGFVLAAAFGGGLWHLLQLARRGAIRRAVDRMREDVARALPKAIPSVSELHWLEKQQA